MFTRKQVEESQRRAEQNRIMEVLEKCQMCKTLFERKGVEFSEDPSVVTKNFRKWAVRNHPDKGGDQDEFQSMAACVDIVKECIERRGFSRFPDYTARGYTEEEPPKKAPAKKAPAKKTGAKKECTPDKIRNPASGRCVKRDGKIGKKLLGEEPAKKTGSKKSASKKECTPDKIRNPASGRCVKKDGKIGKKLLGEEPEKKKSSPKKKSPGKKSEFEKMTVSDLKKYIRERGGRGYSGLRKADLVKMAKKL